MRTSSTKWHGLALLGAAFIMLTAACSGGSSSSNPAAAVNSGGNSGGAAPQLSAARQAVQEASTFPAKIGPTVQLKYKPPAGKTVVFLACEESQCDLNPEGGAAAANALGWTEKTLRYDSSNPATVVAALREALQYKPVAVFLAGVPYDEWKSVLPAYQQAGAVIVPQSLPDLPIGPVVIGETVGKQFSEREGALLANFVTADSDGHANVLFASVPEYPTLAAVQTSFDSTLANICSGCKITAQVNVPISALDAGQFVPEIISGLRRQPSTEYIVTTDGAFVTGLTSALRSAGLANKYKIVSSSAGPQNEQDIKTGVETASTAFGIQELAWLSVDLVLRHMEGMPLGNPDAETPLPLLTKANVFVPNASGDYAMPSDYAAQYKTLWRVG